MRSSLFTLLFAFFFFYANATDVNASVTIGAPKKGEIIYINDSSHKSIEISHYWKFHPGDNMQWASVSFNDNGWDTLKTDLQSDNAGKLFKGTGWFRLHLKIPASQFHKGFILKLSQAGASEIYFNGKRIYKFGVVSTSLANEVPYNPANEIHTFELGSDTNEVIAIRYSAFTALDKKFHDFPGFRFKLENISGLNWEIKGMEMGLACVIFFFTVYFTLALVHFILFLFYRKNRSNLYYSLFTIVLGLLCLSIFIIIMSTNPFIESTLKHLGGFLITPFFIFIVLLQYSIFNIKSNWFFWLIVFLAALADVFVAFHFSFTVFIIAASLLISSVESTRVAVNAVRKRKPMAWLIAASFGLFTCIMVFCIVYCFVGFLHGRIDFSSNDNIAAGIVAAIGLFSLFFGAPISMSIFMAGDYARINKNLTLQLEQVKKLAEENLEKEKEKQQLIARQNEMLEVQVKEKTAEIEQQKNKLEEKNKEITDSITYARRIQTALLPAPGMLADALGEHLVIYMPKDLVSGDFYWCHTSGDTVIFAVADCTGHGVPGAFMSMIGNTILNEIVINRKIKEADSILNELRNELLYTLQKSVGQATRDGMDIALCIWNKRDNTLQYAGANNSLYWISENITNDPGVQESPHIRLYHNHLLELVADKQPIGYQEGKMDTPFTKHIIQLRKGDTIYITSDGYTDQFGGEKNKKFTSRRFRELLASFVNKPIAMQKQVLEDTIEQWKKYETQTDDICIIAIRII